RNGVRIEVFSIGFGTELFGFNDRRGTRWKFSLIPLGGYVKLGGDESNAGLEAGGEDEIPAAERFDLRPRWQKFMVAVAGPVMNILTAVAIPFVTAMVIGVPATPMPVVSRIDAGGAAEAAGLRPGDRIVSFNGTDNPTWRRIEGDALISPEQALPLVVERDGRRLPLTVKPTRRTRDGESYGDLEFHPDLGVTPVVVGGVLAGSPALEAGLKPGDRIIALDGEPARNSSQVGQYIREHKGSIHITVERDGRRTELTTAERRLPEGLLGFSFAAAPVERVGPVRALNYAVQLNLEILRLTGKALGQVFTGTRSAGETLAGPIGIGRQASTAANEAGWSGVFWLLGILSLNLGIFNLLPIPVLDGGMIFMLLVEAVFGWLGIKLSMTLRERIQQVGFVALLLLMGFVITNDLIKEVARFRGTAEDGGKPAATASPAAGQQR
ncbi:MAG: RIP metalloprotease RseP, partial [Pyrinomonadaceae bacterium]